MPGTRSNSNEKIPAEIRDSCADLYDDIAILHLKWRFYRELFQEPENAQLLSNLARAFFQTVEESLRADMLMSIFRLSDPSRFLARGNLSFAILLGKCTDLPKVDNLVTAFQAACGNVRLYRNRYIAHNDMASAINLKEDLLPGVGRSQIDEILRLAREILKAVYGHYANADLEFQPAHLGGARELIDWIKQAQQSLTTTME
jgi:AbiU2